MTELRDNPQCAQEQYESARDANDPGLHAHLTFDLNADVAAPYVATGARPGSPSCASRASTVMSRRPRRFIAQASSRSTYT